MSTKRKKKKDQPTSFTTNIGNVSGPVHTGSGDINIDKISISSSITTKAEFLFYLGFIRSEFEKVQQESLPEETSQQVITELKEVEKEVTKEKPNPETLRMRLEKAKSLLLSAAGLATATKTAVDAIQSLIPQIDPVIQAVSKIFH